jgi:hypothetical protein
MLVWIAAQPTPVVALIMFGGSYALAATAYIVVVFVHRYDQPFSSGGVRVLPTALEDVMRN